MIPDYWIKTAQRSYYSFENTLNSVWKARYITNNIIDNLYITIINNDEDNEFTIIRLEEYNLLWLFEEREYKGEATSLFADIEI